MRIIINDNQKVDLPDTWNDVNIDKFQQIMKAKEKEHSNDDEFVTDLIEIFAEEKVNAISIGSLNDAKHHILKLLESKISEKVLTEFKIGMKKYYLEPDLNKIDTSLFADIDFIIEQEGYWNAFDKIIAMLVREKDVFQFKNVLKKYKADDIEWRAIKFKECLSINQVMGISLFFYHFVRLYLKGINQSSEMKKMEVEI